MVATLAVLAALALTLALPIYPDGLTTGIVAFLALCGVGGLYGLLRRDARQLMALLVPWGLALLLAFLIGGLQGAQPQQAVEDTAPYVLVALGLWAGRGASHPRHILVAVLAVCFFDAALSIWKMPSFAAGLRSTYTYFKITAGLPLVGIYIVGLFAATSQKGRPRRLWAAVLLCTFVVAITLTVSRGMMLAAIFGTVIAAHIRKPSLLWIAGIGLAFLAVLYASTLADIGHRYLRLDQAGTVEGRFREVRTAFEYFAVHPIFGAGLGSKVEVDGRMVAYVHNVAAYHLWKFGLVGTALIAAPCIWILRAATRSPRGVRAVVVGATAAILAYLVTSAAYKTYYLVWLYGVVGGATLGWLQTCARQRLSTPVRTSLPRPTRMPYRTKPSLPSRRHAA